MGSPSQVVDQLLAEAAEIPVPLLFELCSGGTAYEAKPQVKTRIRFDIVLEALREHRDYEVLAYTPYMLIIKTSSGAEVSITKRGRLLIKRVKREDEARTAAYDVLRIGASGIEIEDQKARKEAHRES